MNAPAATLIPIFGTPFAELSLTMPGASQEALAALLTGWATEDNRDPGAPRDPLSYHSRENLFDRPDELTGVLKREMLTGLCAAVRATNLGTAADFERLTVSARARFAIIRPNGCLPAATLPLASWCAIYCVAAPPAQLERPLGGVLRLYEPRLGTMFTDAANWRLRPPFSNGHHIWRPMPGRMAAFPAYLAHEIALNSGEGDLVLVIARARFANPGQEAAPPW